jgi:hypothetical protein
MKLRQLLPFSLLFALGCEEDFDPVSRITSLRILAAQADRPYTEPGSTVNIRLLAHDGRKDRPEDSNVADLLYSVPTSCENPLSDLYYACYPGFASQFQPGEDVTDRLTRGSSFQISISANIIESRPPVAGSAPFGSVFAFSMACSGRVRYLGIQTKPSPQSPPFGCFDDAGSRLGENDFVFAFSRVFVFNDRSNGNPRIDSLSVGGNTFDFQTLQDCADPAVGGTDCGVKLTRCTKSDQDDCRTVKVDIVVPPESQEVDPSGDRGREQVWVDYYATAGKFEDDIRILYDASRGRLSDTDVDFLTPRESGEHKLWAVVHDSRGGVSWVELQLQVED